MIAFADSIEGKPMVATFNELLQASGIDPRQVSLLRHQTERGGRTPNDLWEDDREAFLLYQATQQDVLTFRRPYWASFVSPAKHETLFVGLFEAQIDREVEINWRDQLSGGPVGEGKNKPYYYYATLLSPLLSEYREKLRIEWGNSQRSWFQSAANSNKPIILAPKEIRRPPRRTQSGPSDGLEQTLLVLGFGRRHRTQKVTMLGDEHGVVIYLKNETDRCPIVIHPYYDGIRRELETLPGISLDPDRPFQINSNLTAFPVYRSPHRATPSHYGIALDATDAASIARLATLLRDNRTVETPLGPVTFNERERRKGPTQREKLGLARIGQGEFRLDCNHLWKWRCALSRIAVPELLRASHIKAWHEADDAERLDPYNGLLLAAHVDALFDRHLISFGDDGRLLRSSRITAHDLLAMGIDPGQARIEGLHDRHLVYLAHHRRHLVH
jgi:HNH endonuclease